MGITGLLQMLKPIQKPASVSDFSGRAIGVDAYCWLHKGVYGCAMDLIEGKKTSVYVNYVMKRVNLMLHHKIKPILVFDGGHLPSKAAKEKERRSLRKENKAKGLAFLRAGNKVEAVECFQKSVDITPEMALDVIKACRSKGVDCIVAPYEADAQLSYLYKKGIIQLVISEDSDLLVYGCKKVLYKMDASGNGLLIDLDDLPKLTDLKFHQFSMEKFRHMCILSGCDYLPSVKGIGLMTANKLLRKYSDVWKLFRSLKLGNQYSVTQEYVEQFKQADQTFLYQTVFDPQSETLVPLTAIPEELESTNLEFAGPLLSKEVAIGIALGNIDPISGNTIANFDEKEQVITPDTCTPTPSNSQSDGTRGGGYQRHSLTPRPASWNSSAMYGKGKTLNIQKNLGGLFIDIEPSELASKPFVPPQMAAKDENKCEDESLDNDQLTDMYTSIKPKPKLKRSLQSCTGNTKPLHKSRFKNPFRMCGKEVQDKKSNHVSRYFNIKNPSHPEIKQDDCDSSEISPASSPAITQDHADCVVNSETSSYTAASGTLENMPRLPCFVQEHNVSESDVLEEGTEDKENISGSTSSCNSKSSLEDTLSSRSLKRKLSNDSKDCSSTVESRSDDISHENTPLKMFKCCEETFKTQLSLGNSVTKRLKQVLKERNSPQNGTLSECGITDTKESNSDLLTHFSYQKSGLRRPKHQEKPFINREPSKLKISDSHAQNFDDIGSSKNIVEIDSGYLSDGEESNTDSDCTVSQSSSECVSQYGNYPPGIDLTQDNEDTSRLVSNGAVQTENDTVTKTAKKHITLRPKNGTVRRSGLGRCRSMGITKRTVKATQNSQSIPNLFNYFEYTKRK